jgi:hypothetical protein
MTRLDTPPSLAAYLDNGPQYIPGSTVAPCVFCNSVRADRPDSPHPFHPGSTHGYTPWSCSRPCARVVLGRSGYRSRPPAGEWQKSGDTHRHTAHHSSMAQIWYSHHPFCGQTVEIVRWLRRQTSESLVVKLPDGVQIAIAAWMLDPPRLPSAPRRPYPMRECRRPARAPRRARSLSLAPHHLSRYVWCITTERSA